MTMASSRNASGRIFWGLLLILFGVLFLLDQMEKLDFGDTFSRYWPLILVLAGLWHLVSNNFRSPGGGLLLIVVGTILMLGKLEILGKSLWHYVWPLLIILVGLWIVFGAFGRQGGGRRLFGAKDNELDAFSLFSGLNRRVESQSFRGGKATAIFGGMELDFTQAKLAEEKAALELTAIFGGIEVRVPRSWRLEVDGQPFLGGIEDKHTFVPGSESSPTLHIKASAILGGIEIKD
jgi:predicted membrane protein